MEVEVEPDQESAARSYTMNEQGQITRLRLPGVKTSPLPGSVYRELQSDYRHQRTGDPSGKLKAGLSERQFKRYRTARRRINSHLQVSEGYCHDLLKGIARLALHPCTRGRCFDRMSSRGR